MPHVLLEWCSAGYHRHALHHNATPCNALLHAATHSNTLQHTATHCNTLQRTKCILGIITQSLSDHDASVTLFEQSHDKHGMKGRA